MVDHINRAVRFYKPDDLLHCLVASRCDIAFIQETWLMPHRDYQTDPFPLITPGWAVVTSVHPDPIQPDRRRGRGLMILARVSFLNSLCIPGEPQITLTFIDHITTPSYEFLAAKIGPLYIASIYIKHTRFPPQFEALTSHLAALHPRSCSHIILGGDFNYPSLWPQCRDQLYDILDVVPHLPPQGPIPTHARGSILDYILTSSTINARSVHIIDVPFSDHRLVSVSLSLPPTSPLSRSPDHPSKPPLPISRFRSFHRKTTVAPQHQDAAVREKNDAFLLRAKQLAQDPSSDIDTISSGLNSLLMEFFGQRQHPTNLQRPYMNAQEVRQCRHRYHSSRRRLNRAIRRSAPNSDLLRADVVSANRSYRHARRRAERNSYAKLLQRITQGKIPIFWFLFRLHRRARLPPSTNTHLDPQAAVDFYSALFADPSVADDIISSVPAPDDSEYTLVTTNEIHRALRDFRDSAAGPDHLPPILLKHCGPAVAPRLAELFTQYLRHGLPPSLRQGLIHLLVKKSSRSPDPSTYRPITLLPAPFRLLLRVIDLKIRALLQSDPDLPSADADTNDPAISIPLEQGGFLPNRSTHLQVFLLLLLRDHARRHNKGLFVVFLDIYKAFDTIDHRQLLDVLTSVNLPPPLVAAIHRLLPFFNLSLYGVSFPQQRGLFQGGPLSPLLCILFLADLILFLNGAPNSVFHGVPFPWDHETIQTVVKLLLFADDIVLIAADIPQLQAALDLLSTWARRRRLTFALPKCEAMRLSRARSDQTPSCALPEVTLEGSLVKWVTEKSYLGHLITEAPAHGRRRRLFSPIHRDRVRPLCRALYRTFQASPRCPRLAPQPLRLGVLQVIHFKFLYQCPVLDVEYQALDKEVYRSLRHLLGLHPLTPTALVAADLGLWPSQYYGHYHALRFLWHLRWKYWTKDVFASWFPTPTSAPPMSTQPHDGVMRRFSSILQQYNLSWAHLNETRAFKTWVELLHHHFTLKFSAYTQSSADRHHHPPILYALPRRYPAACLHHQALSIPRLHHLLHIEGELFCAALRLRHPSLRLLPSFDVTDHGRCRYCYTGPENGLHLLLYCHHLPAPFLLSRDVLLRDIATAKHISQINTRRGRERLSKSIMELLWPEPPMALVHRLLVFFRDLLVHYAAYRPSWESRVLLSYPVRRCLPRLRSSLAHPEPPSV